VNENAASRADDEGDAGDGEKDGGDFRDSGLFDTARGHIDQHPHGSGVLHDDGGGDVGALDGEVVEIV
jgi:hypothetical protein